LITVGFSKLQERNGSEYNRSGDNASLFSFLELNDRLGICRKLEGLAVLECGLDVMIVGVEPFDHFLCSLLALATSEVSLLLCNPYQTRHVDGILLVASAHSKIFVDGLELGVGVSSGNGLA
jgi:hypothetical protein